MFRSCQIITRGLCSLLTLYYSIHNSIRNCKQAVVTGYHVVWECVVEQWLGVRRMPSTQHTTHNKQSYNFTCVNFFIRRKQSTCSERNGSWNVVSLL